MCDRTLQIEFIALYLTPPSVRNEPMTAICIDDLPSADPLGQRLCDVFLRNRWDFIFAPLPYPVPYVAQPTLEWQSEEISPKAEWKTERRYPMKSRVLLHRWADPTEVLGVRFDQATEYGLLDIDVLSQYHPRQNPGAIAELQLALETIGITRTVLIRSSHSDGLHLYFPLNGTVNTFNLAVAVKFCLQTQGFEIKDGQLEIFPNDKAFGVATKILYKGHRLPLQPETGSWLLDDDLQVIGDQLSDFFRLWDIAASGQDMAMLNSALTIARQNCLKKPRRRLNNVEAWQQDLEVFIAEGWTGSQQTNHLLKEIGCYGVVFKGLTGEALVNYIYETAIAAPGYSQWCAHQHQMRLRSLHWARACEKYYWPLGTHAKPRVANDIVPFNQRRSLSAQEEVKSAVALLEAEDRLPEGITERAQAISNIAGKSLGTLYRHKGLWHPQHYQPQERSVIDRSVVITAPLITTSNELTQEPKPIHGGKLQTKEKIMKCRPALRDASFRKKSTSSAPKGGLGGEKSFPQDSLPLPLPSDNALHSCVSADSIPVSTIDAIKTQVQRLQWPPQKLLNFISERFDGKRRAQLSDEELFLLLYLLQDQASDPPSC
jgi:hypothetical protein